MAAIGIPLFLFIISFGGIVFTIAIAIISSFALWEFYSIAETKQAYPYKTLGIAVGLALFAYFHISITSSTELFTLGISEIMAAMLLLFIYQLFAQRENPLISIMATLGGILYVPLMMSAFVGIRLYPEIESSGYIFTAMLVTVWICDSAAYFVGKKYGKNKIFPSVSPKKSWQGSIAGFIFAVIAFSLISSYFAQEIPLLHAVIIGALIGSVGQIGDFVESAFKRDAGVKDSGSILPGHGGILDRFDSLIFVAPTVYIYLVLMERFDLLLN